MVFLDAITCCKPIVLAFCVSVVHMVSSNVKLLIIKVNSENKQGLLLEVVQILTDMNLIITKGYISSDGGWFMDGTYVFTFPI